MSRVRVHNAVPVPDAEIDVEILYRCNACGKKVRGFSAKCYGCKLYNTLLKCKEQDPHEDPDEPEGTEEEGEEQSQPKAVRASHVKFTRHQRISFGVPGLDELLANPYGIPPTMGAVRGACISMTGDPGVGKSTLVLMACINAARAGFRVYHADAEEPRENVIDRAKRLGADRKALDNLYINDEAEFIEQVFEDADDYAPDILAINSLNTYYAHGPDGEPLATEAGNPLQLKRVAKLTYKYAHKRNRHNKLITTFLVCQVNKDGDMVGPREVAHAVDAAFEIKKHEDFDTTGLVTAKTYEHKNRFGNSRIKATFLMEKETGILKLVRDGVFI